MATKSTPRTAAPAQKRAAAAENIEVEFIFDTQAPPRSEEVALLASMLPGILEDMQAIITGAKEK